MAQNKTHSHTQLTVTGLSVEFVHEGGIYKAVDDISFTLKRGSSLGIVGESGSGKSVTSLSIMRLVQQPQGRISSGTITFNDQKGDAVNLLDLTEKEMRSWRGKRIAMIFQEPMTSLNPSIRCGKQLIEMLLQHEKISRKKARERTLELFKEVLLPRPEEAYRSYPHQLSGGQKQRVMIAMAIACNPEILIADEPTTALDVTVQKTILKLLKSLQKKYGMSLIFISHDLGVIAEIADEVLVMLKGKIVEKGPISSIFNAPQHPYTKGLLACRPPLGERPRRLTVISDFLSGQPIVEDFVSQAERDLQHTKLYAKRPLLKAVRISTHFKSSRSLFGKKPDIVKAVDEVSFEVYQGETLGLVGESGCGKTTLGRTLLRLIEPTKGLIYYGNQELNGLKSSEMRKMRKKLQIIFQDPYSSLNPRLTAGHAIMEPMQVHGLHGKDPVRKSMTLELLKKVGLEESHFYRYPHEFSGGQRQRICIARALAVEPEFIICDESVSALDVSVQAQVLNLLNDLKKEYDFTYVFISHDLSVVRYMSDRLMVMQNGKIQEIGDSDTLFSAPTSEYTRLLIDAIPKGIK
ncbi:MAG: ABC transporter ATP-binding protein [Bacteroidales bacterium]|nr:ABC transporter ATP-binding protein [Bacteroidales bacterium]